MTNQRFSPEVRERAVRTVESDAHLVDQVFPEAPVRQWVLAKVMGFSLHTAIA